MMNVMDKIIKEDDAIATIKFRDGISEEQAQKIDSIISKNYDQKWIDGLKSDYSNCGAESRLTPKQMKELFEILINPNKHYTLRDARNIIKERYGVEYTPKQVWIITRKKLRLNYRKPYLVYDKAPENADEIFKKKHQK